MNFDTNGGVPLKWLHRFALLTCGATFCLIFVGGLVKSHEAGLSVPDWPNTYGQFMLTFPYSKWVGNIFYEHGHRLFATLVGFFITVQAIWLQRSKVNPKLKWLGWFALLGVILQGVLGGLTVIYLLPVSISTGHSMLAQGVFSLTLLIAVFTSAAWPKRTVYARQAGIDLRKLSLWTVGVIGLQIMLGALMRHEDAGLAIPTFPLANGRLIPEFTSIGVVLNFAHRMGALLTSGFVITTIVVTLRHYANVKELKRLALFGIVVLLVQITLGAITILSAKAVTPTTLHVSGGTLLLGTMLALANRAYHQITLNPSAKHAKAGGHAPALGQTKAAEHQVPVATRTATKQLTKTAL